MSRQNEIPSGKLGLAAETGNDDSNARVSAVQPPQQPFVLLTDESLVSHLFSFLSINDATNLGMTCRQLHAMIVRSSRSLSYPSIIWEERLPTKIGYNDVDVNDNDNVVSVTQRQPFRFILQTAEKETILAEITLLNAVWDEDANMRDGEHCRNDGIEPGGSFPTATRPFISIWRSAKESPLEYYRLFDLTPIRHLDLFRRGNDEWEEENEEAVNWKDPNAVEDLDLAMNILWKCVQRIAVFPDGITYPSAVYLMHTLPIALHARFPPTVTSLLLAAANSSSSGPHVVVDRKTVVEFSYRPSRTLREWNSIVGREIYSSCNAFELREVPWYCPGYSWFSDDDEDSEDEHRHPAKKTKTGT